MQTEQRSPQLIALVGLSGAGKSSVGRELAARLGWAFVDTDQLIEQTTGRTVPQIFAEDGEQIFRDIESVAVREALRQPQRIVATGGGAILRPENRTLLRQQAFVVWLDAPTHTLVARLRAHDEQRPLLATGDPSARLEALRNIRASLYAETANLSIDTSGLTHAQVATYILEMSHM